MPQPTNQPTKEPEKATHWKTAVYDTNADDSDSKFSGQWASLDKLPGFVKTLHRKREICPTTKREHYQIHVVCHKQERLSALSGWIKHTKWFKVYGEDHIRNSIAYISKAETTAPGAKVEVLEGEAYLRVHELLLEIAKFAEFEDMRYWGGKHSLNTWEYITARMVRQDMLWANKLSNPALRRMWGDWSLAFIDKVGEFAEQTLGAFIIEAPGNLKGCFADNSEDSDVPPELELVLDEYAIDHN